MHQQQIKLIDVTGEILATANVAGDGDLFDGQIDLGSLPSTYRALFEEFEELVNDQLFSHIDDVQARIARLGIKAVFASGEVLPVSDLQVYPSLNELTFRLTEAPVRAME